MSREALLALAAAWLGRPEAEKPALAALKNCAPEELARAARANGLAVIAAEAAANLNAPEEVLAPLREAARRETARGLLLEEAAREIGEAAWEKGLKALLLKGPALDRTAYPRPGLRPADDIDLLVKSEEAPVWAELLTGLGYERITGVDRSWRRAGRDFVDLHASSSDLAGVIDVPEGLSPVRLDAGALFGRAVRVEGLSFRVPSPEDATILAAAHGLGVHGFEKLIWLVDVAVLLARGPDVSKLTKLARESGADRLLFHSLVLAGQLGLAEAPESLLNDLCPERIGRLEKKLLKRIARGQLPDRIGYLLALALPAPAGYKKLLIKRALFPRRRVVVSDSVGPLRGALRHAGRLARLAWVVAGP